MKCDACAGALTPRHATRKAPYHYRLSGLDNVYLVGIKLYRCGRCEADSPVIPKIQDLHELIARELARKPARLTGKEVRFLRKQAGFPARHFAALIGVSPEHLSRFENGKLRHVGKGTDRVVRFVSVTKGEHEHVHQALLKMAEELLEQRQAPAIRRPVFEVSMNGRWKSRAA